MNFWEKGANSNTMLGNKKRNSFYAVNTLIISSKTL